MVATTKQGLKRPYTLVEVLDSLGIKKRQFFKNYIHLFTDSRPVHLRHKGTPRRFLRSEVEIASEEGFDALAQFRATGNR